MGQSQSSISPKKSYYSVEYLNADFEQELNKIARKSKETENGDFSVAKKSSSSCVSRSKSFARPENRVLPPLFQKKQLRKTNLLKTDGFRKTWRNNSKLRKSNSTILSSDSPKPGLIRTWLTKSVQNLNRDCDLSSLDSLDQDVNLVDNRKLSNEPQIRVISQFPIDSKVYRHYISGKNVDKLNRSVQASSFIQPVYSKDLEPTYDSIHEFRSKNSNSASSLNSTSTFSSITKSSDLFYGDSNRKYAQDSLNSSVFSALTSSSMVNSTNSMYPKRKYISSADNKLIFQNDYSNNFNQYKNDPCSDQDFSSSHFSSWSNDYDFLSNTNSGLKKNRNQFFKQIPQTSFNFREETRRLNDKFQDEMQKAYTERSKRFEQAKQYLESKSEHFDAKKCPSIKGIDIKSKIKAFEENIIKEDLNLSKPSAFKKIEPKKLAVKVENQRKEIPKFYFCHTNGEQQEQEARMEFSSEEKLDDKIEFIQIVDFKQQKYKFIPEDEESKSSFFTTPPPPPGYKDEYSYLNGSIEKYRAVNSNFILKPKDMDYMQANKDFIPGVILVESQNNSNQASKKINRSFSKSRRKGLDEVFPEINLKSHEYENLIKTNNQWCPASDLNEFEDSDYESSYHVNDNPNYLFNSKGEFLKKSFYLENLRAERNELELSQIFEQSRIGSNYSHHVDHSDILNSIDNFYY